MSISIIIPNLHSALIGDVLNALRVQTVRADICEIIVVGMDRYGLIIEDDLVRFDNTTRPTPPAAARNRGAAVARGDILLFVDADCLLETDAVAQLLNTLAVGYGAVVGAMLPESKPYWVLCNNLMAFPEFLTLDQPGERACLPSFCLMMTRAVWDHIGGFDERFNTVAGEDLDLSFRMRQLGYQLGFTPNAIVRHRPARVTAAAVWRHLVGFGTAWYTLNERYYHMLPFSQALWLISTFGGLGMAATLPIACLYVLRLFAHRRHLWRYWYAIPGMIWAQFGWYNGILEARTRAVTQQR